MKQLSILLFICFISVLLPAQGDTARMHPFKQYMPQDDLDKFNIRQNQINRRGLFVISGWGAANAIYGSIAASQTHGEAQVFHASNAIWGGINMVIGIPGVIASYNKTRAMNMSLGRTILQQHGAEKLYLINGALDVLYIGGGAAMWGFSDRVKRRNVSEGLSGAGKSFIAQGAFLLAFDWAMYIVHSQHAHKALNRYTSGLAYTGTGFSYSLAF